jgi:DNA-binding XRE family transcriptional regulator
MTITPAQIRGARGMLRMLQGDLASAVGLTAASMNAIEAGTSKPRATTTARLRAVMEERGIVFFESDEGRGVMLRGDA